MPLIKRIGTIGALSAAISMAATPAAALELPQVSRPNVVAYQADKAEDYRRDRYRKRDRDGISTGDVLAGVLVLGTIAAIASASSKPKREPQYRDPERSDPQGYRSGDFDAASSGLGRAADMCVSQVERGDDVVTGVDAVNRTGEGWLVAGQLESGAGFTCRIDNSGRIRSLEIDMGYLGASAQPVDDRQLGSDVYARARLARDAAYPGAPPSEEVDDRPVWTGDTERAGQSDAIDGDLGG